MALIFAHDSLPAEGCGEPHSPAAIRSLMPMSGSLRFESVAVVGSGLTLGG